MSIIGSISIEIMLFNNDTKEVLNKITKRNEIEGTYYDEYHEDDDLFFVDREKYTLQGIKSFVRNYFISKTSK